MKEFLKLFTIIVIFCFPHEILTQNYISDKILQPNYIGINFERKSKVVAQTQFFGVKKNYFVSNSFSLNLKTIKNISFIAFLQHKQAPFAAYNAQNFIFFVNPYVNISKNSQLLFSAGFMLKRENFNNTNLIYSSMFDEKKFEISYIFNEIPIIRTVNSIMLPVSFAFRRNNVTFSLMSKIDFIDKSSVIENFNIGGQKIFLLKNNSKLQILIQTSNKSTVFGGGFYDKNIILGSSLEFFHSYKIITLIYNFLLGLNFGKITFFICYANNNYLWSKSNFEVKIDFDLK